MNFIDKMVEQFMKINRRMKRWRRVVSAMAAVVVFVTTYMLILPAITLDSDIASTQAGMEIASSEYEMQNEGSVIDSESSEDQEEAEGSDEDSSSESGSEEAEEEQTGSEDLDDADEGAEDETASDTSDPADTEEEGLTDQEDELGEDAEEGITSEAANIAATDMTAPEIELITEQTQLVYEGDDYIVYADFGEEAKLPVGVELRVSEITEESDPEVYQAYYEKALSEMQDKYQEKSTLSFARFYDIAFVYEGAEIEPSGDVKVRIEYKKAVTVSADTEVDTVHFDKNDEDNVEVVDSEVEKEPVAKKRSKAASNNKEPDSVVKAVEFESDQFSVYGVIGTEIITTPAGELVFQGEGYSIKITYTEKSEIPLGTELSVRELIEGTEEYDEYLARTKAALRGDESEAVINESTYDKISRILSGLDELEQTKIFDIILVYNDEEIEPNPDYPLSVEITYDADISQKEKENKLNAKIVHFASEGTEVISDVDLQKNKDGSVTLAYEQNSFSRTAASLLGSFGNGGWYGQNGNQLVFRYGYSQINGEPVFEIQYNGVTVDNATLRATTGTWPGDPGYPYDKVNNVYLDGTCNPGTTMMELIEACNSSTAASDSSCGGFKLIMGTTYTVNSTTGAHTRATLGTCDRSLEATIGAGFVLGRTSEEYWYSPNKIFRIERGLDANGNGWHDALIYNNGSLPLDIVSGVIIDNKSANSDICVSDGRLDNLTGEIYPIAVISDASWATGASTVSGLTMVFNGCYITDSSYNGTSVGTGVKIINNGSLEMFSHGNTVAPAAHSYIENMAVAVDQINGKTRLKTAADPFGVSHNNTIGVALSYGQSIGKWYEHLSANMSQVPIWLRSVTSWKSGDIVMDSGWQKAGTLRSPVENTSTYMDINKLNLVNQNSTSTDMGLEFYEGTNQDPYPVIRFYAGTVYNTRTRQWYRTLYEAVTPGQKDVTGAATQIRDNDTLVFYGNTQEDKLITINYDVTIRGAYDSEDLNGTETARAALGTYKAELGGGAGNWIQVSQGKTVTFGGNATTDSYGHVGTVTSGTAGTLIIDAGNAVSFDIVNYGTTNLKNNITLSNASVAGVFQQGEEHLYEGALFSGNALDHWLISDGTVNGNHYITLETRNPNNGSVITNKLNSTVSTQFNGRDVVVAGTTDNIASSLDASYLAKFTLTDKEAEYDYVYTVNGGPNGERVLELKQKETLKVKVYKKDDDGNPLNGAGFTLYKDNSGTLTEYTLGSDTNPHITSGNGVAQMLVREGDFVLRETTVPNGYNGASDLTFTVTNNNGHLTLSGAGFSLETGTTDTYKVEVVNPRKTVQVTLKKENTAGAALSGVTFGLDSQTTTHTTGNDGTVSLGTFKYGSTHTLHETWSSPDYEPLNGDISIAVNSTTGVLTATPASGDTVVVTGNATNGYLITVKNKPEKVKVELFKIGEDTQGAGLAGSAFTLTPAVGSAITMTPSATTGLFNVVELEAGTYTITETTTPAGYNTAANGTLTITVNPAKSASVSGTGYIISGPVSDVYRVTVTNERKTVPVKLRKINNEGTALGGVTFTFDGQSPDIVTGDGTGGTTLGEVSLGNLKYGTSHTLHETWNAVAHDYKPLNGDIPISVNSTTGAVTVNPATGDTVTVTGNVTNGYVITVTNMPSTLKVRFKKTAMNGTTALANAVFTTNMTGTSITLTSGSDGILKNGNTSVFALPISSTPYILTETTAPSGYNLLTGNVVVTVSNNGVAAGRSDDVTVAYQVDGPDENGVYTVIITNSTGVELPVTGGSGTSLYTLSGLVLIMAALMYGFRMRRRERRLN